MQRSFSSSLVITTDWNRLCCLYSWIFNKLRCIRRCSCR